MGLESYLELFDKYECSKWLIGQVFGGIFTMIVFIIIFISLCVNLTIYFIDYLKGRKHGK